MAKKSSIKVREKTQVARLWEKYDVKKGAHSRSRGPQPPTVISLSSLKVT